MKKGQRVALVNVAGLVGICISLFIVPSSAPFWLWVAVSAVVLAALNYGFFRLRTEAGLKDGPAKGFRTTTAIIVVGFTILLELVFKLGHC